MNSNNVNVNIVDYESALKYLHSKLIFGSVLGYQQLVHFKIEQGYVDYHSLCHANRQYHPSSYCESCISLLLRPYLPPQILFSVRSIQVYRIDCISICFAKFYLCE